MHIILSPISLLSSISIFVPVSSTTEENETWLFVTWDVSATIWLCFQRRSLFANGSILYPERLTNGISVFLDVTNNNSNKSLNDSVLLFHLLRKKLHKEKYRIHF